MKKTLIIGLLALGQFALAGNGQVGSVESHECYGQVIKRAQAELDLNAQAMDFDSSYIDKASVKLVSETRDQYGGRTTKFSVTGSIYKAGYTIQMTLEGCALKTLNIAEVE